MIFTKITFSNEEFLFLKINQKGLLPKKVANRKDAQPLYFLRVKFFCRIPGTRKRIDAFHLLHAFSSDTICQSFSGKTREIGITINFSKYSCQVNAVGKCQHDFKYFATTDNKNFIFFISSG